MGYFPNGTSGLAYQETYCFRCLHYKDADCAVWNAHLEHNYSECNNDGSILHDLIPRSEDRIGNERCLMFMEDPNADQMDLFEGEQ